MNTLDKIFIDPDTFKEYNPFKMEPWFYVMRITKYDAIGNLKEDFEKYKSGKLTITEINEECIPSILEYIDFMRYGKIFKAKLGPMSGHGWNYSDFYLVDKRIVKAYIRKEKLKRII